MRSKTLRRALSVETLERRALLAADLATLHEGLLSVQGTGNNDSITVAAVDTQLTVTVNGHTYSFNAADVTGIKIDAGYGNDWVSVGDTVLVDALINLGAGNDRATGGGGDDTLCGDNGNDRLIGGLGNDRLFGQSGNDWLGGGDGDDVEYGGYGDDCVFGGLGNDQLFGNVGNDFLHGWDGDDLMFGGYNHDCLRGGNGNDRMHGEAGYDNLYGDAGEDELFGGGDNDKLFGCMDDDILKGERGDDYLHGGSGDDLLDGDEGDDDERDGYCVDLDAELRAEMFALSGAVARADFEHEIEDGVAEMELKVEVSYATPGAVLDIVVDGMLIGSLTVGADGRSRLEFSNDADDPGELPFPAGLNIHPGSTISIGSELSGTFGAAYDD
jgi:RTX calcium-binding nonapeptide repeat (4 copies)